VEFTRAYRQGPAAEPDPHPVETTNAAVTARPTSSGGRDRNRLVEVIGVRAFRGGDQASRHKFANRLSAIFQAAATANADAPVRAILIPPDRLS
jgi:hypothetical protein